MVGDGDHGLRGERGAGGDSVGHSPIHRVTVTAMAILVDEALVHDDQSGHIGEVSRIGRDLDLDRQESEATHKLETHRTSRIELPAGWRESQW